MQVLSDMIENADITQYQKRQMQKEITIFEDILGGCERLLRTPIPVSYTRHSTRCIMIWLLTFPIWLQQQIGPALIPTTALVAFLLPGACSNSAAVSFQTSCVDVCVLFWSSVSGRFQE